MKVLAIDQATKCGWCSPSASGTWDLSPNRGESIGMRNIRFRSKLKEVVEAEGIEMIVHERVAGRHQGALIVAGGLVGVIHLVCEDLGLEYACYSAGEIKKFATGKGNAKKDAMIDSAKKAYEYRGLGDIDDNEADALHLWHMVMEELG